MSQSDIFLGDRVVPENNESGEQLTRDDSGGEQQFGQPLRAQSADSRAVVLQEVDEHLNQVVGRSMNIQNISKIYTFSGDNLTEYEIKLLKRPGVE